MRIGIFWIYNGEIFAKTELPESCLETEEIRDIPTGHYEYWPLLQQKYRVFRDMGYDEVPRGRVVQKRGAYIVYASNVMLASGFNRELIEQAFKKELGDSVEFVADEHYKEIRRLGFESFIY